MSGALSKLIEERKEWRKNPLFGFVAKPSKNIDGSLNCLVWDCYIPGRNKTIRQGAMYHLLMTFSDDFPCVPPECKFEPPLFHPNITESGILCLPSWKEDARSPGTKQTLSVKSILTAIQDILHEPDFGNPVNLDAYFVNKRDKFDFKLRVKGEAKKSHDAYYKQGITN